MAVGESRFRIIFASIITAVWAGSTVVSLLVPEYQPPPGIHTLMLAVAGWAFGKPVASAVRGKNGDRDSK